MAIIFEFPDRHVETDFGRDGLVPFIETLAVDDSFAETYGIELSDATIASLREAAKARRTHPAFSRAAPVQPEE